MKLVTEIKTNVYELTYLVTGGFTDSEQKRVQEEVVALVEKHKGEVLSQEVWGKKPLAYTIRKEGKTYDEASYIHLRIRLVTKEAPEFEKDIYLNNDVIRHLLIVEKKQPETKEVSKESKEE